MSEYREECSKCIKNSTCIGDYGSIYCTLNRKYNFNIDYAKDKDTQVTTKLFDINLINSKIEKMEQEYKEALDENSTRSFILKCQIEGFKDFRKELLKD